MNNDARVCMGRNEYVLTDSKTTELVSSDVDARVVLETAA